MEGEENDPRISFMINLHESMGRDRIKLVTLESAVGLTTDCPTGPVLQCMVVIFSGHTLLLFVPYAQHQLKSHWLKYTSICWYLRVLPVLHRLDVVDIGVNTV